jgi:CheY-like chemotaxis protein
VLVDQADAAQELVEVFVRDTGVGMPEQVRRRAFDPFFTTKGVKGTGLGLAVVYSIIARHAGEVLLESQEGLGTTVILRLPAAAAGPAASREAALPLSARAGKIVVVDDEEALALVLADILRLQHHQVEPFTDPRRALEHLSRTPADLLFTDLGMPEMSGWEVAHAARALRPDLPVILVTGWGHQIDPAEVQARRITGVVAKPYKLEDILRAVAEILPAPPS